jgi:glutaredoxin
MMFQILKVLLWPFRLLMSVLIPLYSRVFSPKPIVRAPERQVQVDSETRGLVLYHFEACPFCVKVRRHVQRLGLKIEMRDVKKDKGFKKELLEGGGEFQVPCLRIRKQDGTDQWMYESGDINDYLSSRFAS